jgi:hypothetical protein
MKTLRVLLLTVLIVASASAANACEGLHSTNVEIYASQVTVCPDDTVDLTILELNDGDVPLTNVLVKVRRNGSLIAILDAPPDGGDAGEIGVLDPGEQWVWIIPNYPVWENTKYEAFGYGECPDGCIVQYCDAPGATSASATVPAIICDEDEYCKVEVKVEPCNPSTMVTITKPGEPVCEGEAVTLTICEQNTGNVNLVDVWIDVNGIALDGSEILFQLPAPPHSGDNGDEILEPGETWCWEVEVIVNTTTPLIATGHGKDPLGTDITWPYDPNERDDVTVETKPCGGEGCRLTGGGVTAEDPDGDCATFGGQAGANTALPPQPKGEWTHTQQKGPHGSFTFHGGTASSPAGSEIIEIRCSDPGGCKPSGDPPSPAKQLDFDGVGTFKNFGTKDRAPIWLFPGANAKCSSQGGKFRFDGTFHYFQVNADDLGEPGNKNLDAASDPQTCPPNGFGEKGDLPLADCNCADFYRITIYDGVDVTDVVWIDGKIDINSLNTTDVIYEFHGYIDGGNLQIHHLTGYDLVSLEELAASWLEGV